MTCSGLVFIREQELEFWWIRTYYYTLLWYVRYSRNGRIFKGRTYLSYPFDIVICGLTLSWIFSSSWLRCCSGCPRGSWYPWLRVVRVLLVLHQNVFPLANEVRRMAFEKSKRGVIDLTGWFPKSPIKKSVVLFSFINGCHSDTYCKIGFLWRL